jgi:hypothetical protein
MEPTMGLGADQNAMEPSNASYKFEVKEEENDRLEIG